MALEMQAAEAVYPLDCIKQAPNIPLSQIPHSKAVDEMGFDMNDIAKALHKLIAVLIC